MQRKILRTIALASFALVVGLGAAGEAQAQDVKAPYPNMAPLDQYLMERNAEIELARSVPRNRSHGMPRSGSSDGMVTNGRERQEWFRVPRGAIVDVSV
jgi:hypothetical protein